MKKQDLNVYTQYLIPVQSILTTLKTLKEIPPYVENSPFFHVITDAFTFHVRFTIFPSFPYDHKRFL